jgi:hypothetical protein
MSTICRGGSMPSSSDGSQVAPPSRRAASWSTEIPQRRSRPPVRRTRAPLSSAVVLT